MGTWLKARTVKWGDEEERMIAEIQRKAREISRMGEVPSKGQVVRTAIKRLYVEMIMEPEYAGTHSGRQELLRMTGCYPAAATKDNVA